MKELNEEEKQDILKLDEVMTFFLIDECSSILWKTTHDIANGKVKESPEVINELNKLGLLQKFAVKNLDRFGLNVENVGKKDDDKEKSDLKKWHTHWYNWRANLSDEQWETVSTGKYDELLPTKKWNEEDL